MNKPRFLSVTAVLLLSLALFTGAALADNPPPKEAEAPPETSTSLGISDGQEATIAPEALWPGPDGFGYSGSTPAYNWIDITTTGTLVTGWTNLDDGYAGPFNIGFTFNFYGTGWTQFYTGSNGFLSFGAGSTSLSNQCPLPNSTTPNNIIPILWDDLNLNTSGNVYYQTFATCPVGTGQCLVIEYYNMAHYGGVAGSAGTWEVILYDDHSIVTQFSDSGDETGSGSTTGIENDNAAADYGLTFACFGHREN